MRPCHKHLLIRSKNRCPKKRKNSFQVIVGQRKKDQIPFSIVVSRLFQFRKRNCFFLIWQWLVFLQLKIRCHPRYRSGPISTIKVLGKCYSRVFTSSFVLRYPFISRVIYDNLFITISKLLISWCEADIYYSYPF